jgi:hypothetical protein
LSDNNLERKQKQMYYNNPEIQAQLNRWWIGLLDRIEDLKIIHTALKTQSDIYQAKVGDMDLNTYMKYAQICTKEFQDLYNNMENCQRLMRMIDSLRQTKTGGLETQLQALIKQRDKWSQALGEVDKEILKRKSSGGDSMAFQLIMNEMCRIDIEMEKIIAVMKQYKEYTNFKFPACELAHVTDFPDDYPTEAVE